MVVVTGVRCKRVPCETQRLQGGEWPQLTDLGRYMSHDSKSPPMSHDHKSLYNTGHMTVRHDTVWYTCTGRLVDLLQLLKFVASEGESLEVTESLEAREVREVVVGQAEVPELGQPLQASPNL